MDRTALMDVEFLLSGLQSRFLGISPLAVVWPIL